MKTNKIVTLIALSIAFVGCEKMKSSTAVKAPVSQEMQTSISLDAFNGYVNTVHKENTADYTWTYASLLDCIGNPTVNLSKGDIYRVSANYVSDNAKTDLEALIAEYKNTVAPKFDMYAEQDKKNDIQNSVDQQRLALAKASKSKISAYEKLIVTLKTDLTQCYDATLEAIITDADVKLDILTKVSNMSGLGAEAPNVQTMITDLKAKTDRQIEAIETKKEIVYDLKKRQAYIDNLVNAQI